MKTFVIGDLHFKHLKVAQARGFETEEAHDQTIIDNWNRVVGDGDLCICLGDFSFQKTNPALSGKKILIVGNHDHKPYPEGFKVRAMREVGKMLLSHIPVHPMEMKRWRLNVHAHLHDKVVTRLDCTDACNMIEREDCRYFCASAEQINMTPIDIEEIKARRF